MLPCSGGHSCGLWRVFFLFFFFGGGGNILKSFLLFNLSLYDDYHSVCVSWLQCIHLFFWKLNYWNYYLKLCFPGQVLSLFKYVHSSIPLTVGFFISSIDIWFDTAISPIPLFFRLSMGLLRVLCWYISLISSQLL